MNPVFKDAVGFAFIIIVWLVIIHMMFGVVCDPTGSITGLGRTKGAPTGSAMRVAGGE